jgi:hypothetical protein
MATGFIGYDFSSSQSYLCRVLSIQLMVARCCKVQNSLDSGSSCAGVMPTFRGNHLVLTEEMQTTKMYHRYIHPQLVFPPQRSRISMATSKPQYIARQCTCAKHMKSASIIIRVQFDKTRIYRSTNTDSWQVLQID